MTEWSDDEDTISDVLRIELIASEQGFNGTAPGPTIEANVGETLIVRLINQRGRPSCFCFGECSCTETQPGATGEYRFVLKKAGTFRYCSCDGGSCLYGTLKVV